LHGPGCSLHGRLVELVSSDLQKDVREVKIVLHPMPSDVYFTSPNQKMCHLPKNIHHLYWKLFISLKLPLFLFTLSFGISQS
jgi:hypothetical protein